MSDLKAAYQAIQVLKQELDTTKQKYLELQQAKLPDLTRIDRERQAFKTQLQKQREAAQDKEEQLEHSFNLLQEELYQTKAQVATLETHLQRQKQTIESLRIQGQQDKSIIDTLRQQLHQDPAIELENLRHENEQLQIQVKALEEESTQGLVHEAPASTDPDYKSKYAEIKAVIDSALEINEDPAFSNLSPSSELDALRQLNQTNEQRILEQQQQIQELTHQLDQYPEKPRASSWAEDQSSLVSKAACPVPDFGLHSVEVYHVLNSWTTDIEKQNFVMNWLDMILSGDLLDETAIELTDLSPPVLDAFLLLVVPILREREQQALVRLRVHKKPVAKYKHLPKEDQKWDLRLWAIPVDPDTCVASQIATTRQSIIQEKLEKFQTPKLA